MQSKPETALYEYAVIRYVPSIEREEFVNIGLAMMCKRRRWIRVEIRIPAKRVMAFDVPHTIDEIEWAARALADVAMGKKEAGPNALLPVEERFRWLTAAKSAAVQTSRPHPGKCVDLDACFDRMFAELVS